MAPDAETRRLIARMGGLTRAATVSGTEMTAAARKGFRKKLYDATDPALPAAERERQADAAHQLHMNKMAMRAKAKREKFKAARQLAAIAEQLLSDADAL